MMFKPNKRLFPFQSRFIELRDGHKIHYVDEGKGPVLLMLHGNPTWSFLYRKMIGELKDSFRCIAPDLPGFGLSEATRGYDFTASSHFKVLEEFVRSLQLDSFILVGQDWGGPMGLRLAETFPEKTRGLVLGNTWAWPLKGHFRYEMFSWLNGGPIGRWMARSFNGVWRVFMQLGFANKPSREELEMYQAPFKQKVNRIQTAVFPRELIKAYAFEKLVEDELTKVKHLPVLFCWGNQDFAFKLDALERFKGHFPYHETILLEAGHFWQHDRPLEASKAIKSWYKKEHFSVVNDRLRKRKGKTPLVE